MYILDLFGKTPPGGFDVMFPPDPQESNKKVQLSHSKWRLFGPCDDWELNDFVLKVIKLSTSVVAMLYSLLFARVPVRFVALSANYKQW